MPLNSSWNIVLIVLSVRLSGMSISLNIFFFFLVYLYLFWELESKQGRGRDREREFQAGSMMSAQSLMQGSSPRTVRSLPELKLRVGRLTDWGIQAPHHWTFSSWVMTRFRKFILVTEWRMVWRNKWLQAKISPKRAILNEDEKDRNRWKI